MKLSNNSLDMKNNTNSTSQSSKKLNLKSLHLPNKEKMLNLLESSNKQKTRRKRSKKKEKLKFSIERIRFVELKQKSQTHRNI